MELEGSSVSDSDTEGARQPLGEESLGDPRPAAIQLPSAAYQSGRRKQWLMRQQFPWSYQISWKLLSAFQ